MTEIEWKCVVNRRCKPIPRRTWIALLKRRGTLQRQPDHCDATLRSVRTSANELIFKLRLIHRPSLTYVSSCTSDKMAFVKFRCVLRRRICRWTLPLGRRRIAWGSVSTYGYLKPQHIRCRQHRRQSLLYFFFFFVRILTRSHVLCSDKYKLFLNLLSLLFT